MIQIEELRVGSWVMHNGVAKEICGTLGDYAGKKVIIQKSAYQWVWANEIESIPYSPEWAEKVMPASWEARISINPATTFTGYWIEGDGFNLPFRYVHDLQNIVQALNLHSVVAEWTCECGRPLSKCPQNRCSMVS